MSEADLARQICAGDTRAIARGLSLIEDTRTRQGSRQRELLASLLDQTPARHAVVGITGAPGAGKSSLASALITHWLDAGLGVGMTAVDPTSPLSGGALLGDRARLDLPLGARAFVRSLASRDRLGGLAPAARAVTLVLRAAFDWTLVETVGVGQSETAVRGLADTVVLLLPPGSGDTLQFMKAGIMEIPDIFVVHKADLGKPAERTHADLSSVLGLRAATAPPDSWVPPILSVSAKQGTRVAELAAAIAAHHDWLCRSGTRDQRRAAAHQAWALARFQRRFGTHGIERVGGRRAARAVLGAGDPLAGLAELERRFHGPVEPARAHGRRAGGESPS